MILGFALAVTVLYSAATARELARRGKPRGGHAVVALILATVGGLVLVWALVLLLAIMTLG